MTRGDIVAAARDWLGTPYRHQASAKQAGADCLGLVRGVWRDIIGPEPQTLPPYTPDWDAREENVSLEAGLARWMAPARTAQGEPGDVAIFCMAEGAPAKHAAILTDRETLIHAYWGRAVVESRFGHWWRKRFVRAFSFPGAEPWRN